ncbi:MAG: hypothetical protein MUO60_17810 [Clostridiaceae bacterium]|nr:hypothetical protein [Clostridiaceae bacterium]
MPGCKVCQLLKSNPELYIEVHERVMNFDDPHMDVIRWLNSQAALHNASLPLDATEEDRMTADFNGANFSVHFKKHIASAALAAKELRKKIIGRDIIESRGTAFNEEDKAVVEGFLYSMTEELTDYTDITRMIKTMETLLWRFESETLNPPLVPGKTKRPVNLVHLVQFKDLVSNLADMKLKLAKLRNSSHVAGAAVKSALASSVDVFINNLIAAAQEAEESFKESIPNSTVGAEILEILRNKLAEGMRLSLKQIIAETFKEYHIK